ncbi:MAG: DEAD/DEAH box helicase [Acidobacteriaceae bacterium]|nr:DEAD/DEAH box helicase [Acidobacteriaceae bacterium]
MHSTTLTPDLLDFGYGILALALELRDANRSRAATDRFDTTEALRVAAEAIESAVRRGDARDGDQGRHLVISAAAFHLGGYAARSYSLLPLPALDRNLASHERCLGYLLRRDLSILRAQILQWHNDPAHGDDVVAARLTDENDPFGADDAAVLALTAEYHHGIGLADTALALGDRDIFDSALQLLEGVIASAAEIGNIPTWWVATLTLHLLRDIWDQSLHVMLPSVPDISAPQQWNDLRRDFISLLGARTPPHIDLWPSQIVAAKRAVDPSDDLVIALPTSAGKTRIAELCILRAMADGRRIVYVTPLRALSAQVERVLARTFVPLGATVTSLYGASGATLIDTETLAGADIVVATPEKLDFALRQDPNVLDDVALIVFDEGHMIGAGSREIRYEVLIQRLLRREDSASRRIVCLSAMFNPEDDFFKDFGNWLRSDEPGDFVHVQWRPTRQRFATLDWNMRTSTGRLSFLDGEQPYVPAFVSASAPQRQRRNPFPQNDKEFCICAANAFARDGHTVLVYSPQRNQVEPLASEFRRMSDQGYLPNVNVPKPEHMGIAKAIGCEWLGENHAAVRALEIGVGTHHGALPRPFLTAIEQLLDARRLPVVVASPTLAQGIDLACSVLIFRSLKRYEDGEWRHISIAEFSNVVGRAGRAYVDLDGIAVLPIFASDSRAELHRIFERMIEKSRGQRLLSGLAQLIWRISEELRKKFGVQKDALLEYVLNQHDLWSDTRLAAAEPIPNDEDELEDSLEKYISDLDVALFSLVEPLETDVEELATVLDEVLKDSLWKRTLARASEAQRNLEVAVLRSRANWLWRNTTVEQRKACFFSGLGRQPGLFIHERLDELVDLLSGLQAAITCDDADTVADSAVKLARIIMPEKFFSVRKLPENWEYVLAAWVKGAAFSQILHARRALDAQRTQSFVQDGVVFRLVWAAEAVRVQAIATEHPRRAELGDGPAFVLTYGVPTIPAALLCQMGFSSRVGAIWVPRQLAASFKNNEGLREWLRENDAILEDADFWESEDHYLLWRHAAAPSGEEYPRGWNHKTYQVAAKWSVPIPEQGTVTRIIPGTGRTATICGADLYPFGTVQLPFNPHGVALRGTVASSGQIAIDYFGSA